MEIVDSLLTDEFIFRVPVWTVACTGATSFKISSIPMEGETYGESVFGLFTDDDLASRYLASIAPNEERFRVVKIEIPQHLEFWIQIAEKFGLTHAVFDFTFDPESGNCSGRIIPLDELRRTAKAMRPSQ